MYEEFGIRFHLHKLEVQGGYQRKTLSQRHCFSMERRTSEKRNRRAIEDSRTHSSPRRLRRQFDNGHSNELLELLICSQPLTSRENQEMAATSATLDHESMKEQIAALMRVLLVKKSFEEDSTPCEIDEGLYLGSVGSVRNKDALKNLNITHILTVAGKWAPTHRTKFVSKVIDVADRDDTNLKQYFDECFDFIDEAKRNGGCVLVHCYAGKSRSVTIVVAYLMKTRGMSLFEALQHVKNKRPQAAPNCGFIRQLEDFEKSLQGPSKLR